jgi:hypothetical protein
MLFELPKPDYGFQPGEVVGVGSAYDLPNLKQNLLLFDKFLLVHKRGDAMRGRQTISPDIEWLKNQGIAVQQPEPIFGGSSNIEAYRDRVIVTFESDEFRFLPNKPIDDLRDAQDSIADVVNSILCRLESQTLNDSGEIDAVPIIPSLTYQRIEGTIPTKKADVQSIVFRSLPVPDEITSLEQIRIASRTIISKFLCPAPNSLITNNCCVQSANGTTSLMDKKNNLRYSLVNANSELKSGEQVKLLVKKKKDKEGNLTFRVKKIKHDYGPCQQ